MEDPAGPRNLDEDRIDDALLQLQSIERSLLELSQHTLQPQVTIDFIFTKIISKFIQKYVYILKDLWKWPFFRDVCCTLAQNTYKHFLVKENLMSG